MARLDASWLAGFLVVLCAGLWFLHGMFPPTMRWLSQESTRLSPMDMPDWYRIPLERGERYIELGPVGILSGKQVTEKRAAVRGFW
jgi:hypothetical protein